MNFGEKLRSLRMKNNLTQEELAKKMAISTKTIGRWEKEDNIPDIEKIKKICKILKCPVSELMPEVKEEKKEILKEEKVSKREMPVSKKEQVNVSLNHDDSKKLKGLSKAISIIAKIVQVCLAIAIAGIVILMICIPTLFKYIDVTNDMVRFRVGDDALIIKENQNEITLLFNEEKLVSTSINNDLYNRPILNFFKTTSETSIIWHLEILMVVGIAGVILTLVVFRYIAKFFENIRNQKTPWILGNVHYLQKIAYFMIGMIILANIGEIILVHLVDMDFRIQINLYEILVILSLFALSYIFKYGVNMQNKLDGEIYSE